LMLLFGSMVLRYINHLDRVREAAQVQWSGYQVLSNLSSCVELWLQGGGFSQGIILRGKFRC
jgi:hypothetical protein